ncbi:hypothetical protein SPRG_13035 [Saprolegnia parasitica CBS 223.65]|uniref:Uncharacterized protein n=1 Tax=Saprolegnia parasitica (strain CBS 223.65) TaxID=695850 RepID=A0A067C4J2_SAPPC|nr:hypothetical protein SPRG_13035 [Saprolegnia parasitica CBS 223.65]KDO21697.1 hypothetical protein SPRG_13035 [Saprolegnia parasitica CBS 223.65]|eukprot:XP_012207618.1 hypothetical protein SPRG_13035 [Saprolegnia parasitica CBS 223.65]
MDATLCNPVLLRLITAYQHGWWPDSLGFRDDPLIFASSNLTEQVAAFGDRFAPWLARHGLDGAIGLMQLYPPLAPCVALHAAATGDHPLRAAAMGTSRDATSWAAMLRKVASHYGQYDRFEDNDDLRLSTQLALRSRHVETVRQNYEERGPHGLQQYITTVVADGYLPTVHFLVHETTVLWPHDAYDIAVRHGHKDVATYLAERGIGRVTSHELSATTSPLKKLQLVHAHFPDMDLKHSLEVAAMDGHDDVVEYILATGTSSVQALELAARYGHLACCQRLLAYERASHPDNLLPVSVIVAAVKGGNDAIIELLHPVQLWTHEYMDTCAEFGRLDLVTSLHNAGRFAGSYAAMIRAATNGHLAVVQFLKTHQYDDCGELVMHGAAGHGHLDVVVFLHEHCDHTASPYALFDAAKRGHVDVVRYLHSVMHTPVLDTVPERAARRGHLEVVRYLHEEGLGQWSPRVMDIAAASGNCDLVAYLHTHRSEGCSPAALDDAVIQEHLEVVRYLCEVVRVTPTIAPSALRQSSADVLVYLDSIGVDILGALSSAYTRRFVALAEYLAYRYRLKV